jgi:Transposase DDE domain
VPHKKRPLEDKESERWVSTANRAKDVLAAAAMVTVIDDREGDFYAKWAGVAGANIHLLSRCMHDRVLANDASMFATAASWSIVDTASLDLMARANRPERKAKLALRFGRVTLQRPYGTSGDLPKTTELTLIEVVELDPPAEIEPLHWYLLTTHVASDAASAWKIVNWYKKRWTIEQLFRILKTQGLQLEDSQIETADRLLKLTAIAAKAAAITLQLVQARDGQSAEPASNAFNENQIEVLSAFATRYEGSTKLQSNPHPPRSLAWAAWIVARLGGWDGYPRTKPGPITMKHGLQYFLGVAQAWRTLKDV